MRLRDKIKQLGLQCWTSYWQDNDGNITSQRGDHTSHALIVLQEKNIPLTTGPVEHVLKLGYIRLVVIQDIVHFFYTHEPTNNQLRKLRDFAIEKSCMLWDDKYDKLVDF